MYLSMSSRESQSAITNISKIVIIALFALVIVISGTAWISFQPTQRCYDVCVVTLYSLQLRSGSTASDSSLASSNFTFALTNPGSTTYISSISLWSRNLTGPISYWSESNNKSGIVTLDEQTTIAWNLGNGTTTSEIEQLNQAVHSVNGPNQLNASVKNQSFTFFPVTGNETIQIINGQNCNFIISFLNGQSISGSVVAQP